MKNNSLYVGNPYLDQQIFFRNLCRKNSLPISQQQLDRLESFQSLLLSWNKNINLISRQDENNIWQRHLLGSVSFLFKFQLQEKTEMLDVGTGGGLPGIPLAILLPDMKITLIDSIRKKADAVRKIVETLKLENVMVDCGRAEELAKQRQYAQRFDYVISRAVAPLKNLIMWCKPFMRIALPDGDNHKTQQENKMFIPRGSMLMLKGGDMTREMDEAVKKCKPKNLAVFPLSIISVEDLFDKKLVVVQP